MSSTDTHGFCVNLTQGKSKRCYSRIWTSSCRNILNSCKFPVYCGKLDYRIHTQADTSKVDNALQFATLLQDLLWSKDSFQEQWQQLKRMNQDMITEGLEKSVAPTTTGLPEKRVPSFATLPSRTSIIFSEATTSEVSYIDTDSVTSSLDAHHPQLLVDMHISQPIETRLAAMDRLNAMAIGDLVTGHTWYTIRTLLEANLAGGEER